MMRWRNWTRKMKMNMERPYVVHAVSIMALMNSGFAVTSARSGSMGNVWRSPLLGLSISSSTSVHHAVTIRELALEDIITSKVSIIYWSSCCCSVFLSRRLSYWIVSVWHIVGVYLLVHYRIVLLLVLLLSAAIQLMTSCVCSNCSLLLFMNCWLWKVKSFP